MATKKKTQKAKRLLVLKSGATFEILSDSGKYFKCEGTQFRKGNPEILKIETLKEAKEAEEKEAKDNADH